ncbi:winged helix-turn-helix domain-containing protein [Virgisporangium aurantiacum]|uniref:Winged helix-turn-helix domain-containing protein n=1 Tax=Virgisporangium aurantiacum TaxID=175570 RepID=A0A8J3Z6T0_9ACTN|nr:crosslink repair DNA glycosylase YcaQ family protein [Virgisporangium aurantiacum]GIJ58022.1 hypothetical protein Vau01_055380 [Virgisporangium aurantiacum]
MEISSPQARRIALHAQGFGKARPARPTMKNLRDAVRRLGAVQIDAVNVLVRAQYLTLYSRLGPYPTRMLDELVHERREAFEYWGHAASILPIEFHPLVRWQMARYAESKHWLAFLERLNRERPGYLHAVQNEISERGPLTYPELTDPARRERDHAGYAESTLLWYRWSDGKTALDGLFNSGRLAAAGRKNSQRRYDLSERVIPADILALPTPTEEEAQRAMIRHAATALGVATAKEIGYYFFLPMSVTNLRATLIRKRIAELVDSGDLQTVRVEGWRDPAYTTASVATGPVRARALLSPFDSLLFERDRVERVFGFRHSFELYVKPANRAFGYYVLPFLLGDELVGRVDVKADRARATLLVPAAYAEPGRDTPEVAAELAAELRILAGWLNLEHIEPGPRGNLAPLLAKAL